MKLVETLLAVAVIYCAGMWGYLAARSIRTGTDYETETYHLGLCLILALGFLGLILSNGG